MSFLVLHVLRIQIIHKKLKLAIFDKLIFNRKIRWLITMLFPSLSSKVSYQKINENENAFLTKIGKKKLLISP